MANPQILEAHGVKMYFAGVRALDSVEFRLETGEILGLIGPNGAGKSTLVNVLTGYEKPTAGSVLLGGLDITRLSPHRLARMGVVRTFQSVRLFEGLSILENVVLGGIGVGIGRQRAREDAFSLLARIGISPSSAELSAGGIPHGTARLLGILRALAARPRFLLLDEPAAGLNEGESDELMTTLSAIPEEFDCGVMVIEHDMRVIMGVCQRIHVLDGGKTLCVGRPGEVKESPAVRAAYLGTRLERAGRVEH